MIPKKSIDIAVKWWRTTLLSNLHHDNGDNSPSGALTAMFADMMAKPIEQQQIDTFCETLTNLLQEQKEKSISLYCDYGPGWLLADAAEKAGISDSSFPWKTGIRVSAHEVTEIMPYKKQAFGENVVYCDKAHVVEMIEASLRSVRSYCERFEETMNDDKTEERHRLSAMNGYASLLQSVSNELVGWQSFLETRLDENGEYCRE